MKDVKKLHLSSMVNKHKRKIKKNASITKIEISSWLVSANDFYSRVVKDR